MKSIKDLIYEASGEDQLKDYIIAQLNVVSIEVLEKIKSLLDREGLTGEVVDEFFRKKGLDDCSDLILSIFNDCGDIQCLSDHIHNPIKISSKDLASNNNLYDLLKPYVKLKTLHKLTNFRPSKNTVARGPYEVILDLFLRDITDCNVGHADVNTNELGEIELKGPKARIKGSLKPAPGNCTAVFNSLMAQYKINLTEDNIFQGSKYTKSLMLKLRDDYNLSEEQICGIIAKSILGKYIHQNTTGVENELTKFLIDHIKEVFDRTQYAKFIFYTFLITDMYFYQNSEGWDYIMIFRGSDLNKSNGNYILIDSKDITKGIESIYNIFQEYNVSTPSSAIHDKDSFSQACQIVVK